MSCADLCLGQLTTPVYKNNFVHMTEDSFKQAELIIDNGGRFELIIDEHLGCTTGHFYYGNGNYVIGKDSIQLFFDPIPTLASSSKIDSTESKSKFVSIEVSAKDENGNLLENLNLSWAKPKKRFRWVTARFDERKFDNRTIINFKRHQALHFLRVSKEGYYSIDLKLPQKISKNFVIDVILRPKPRVKSLAYFSNIHFALPILSECDIILQEDIILRKTN